MNAATTGSSSPDLLVRDSVGRVTASEIITAIKKVVIDIVISGNGSVGLLRKAIMVRFAKLRKEKGECDEYEIFAQGILTTANDGDGFNCSVDSVTTSIFDYFKVDKDEVLLSFVSRLVSFRFSGFRFES